MHVSEAVVKALAPDPASFRNADAIEQAGQLVQLNSSPDGHILFGECLGSGKSSYTVSADFTDESSPAFSCSCPSRKRPCKHALALTLAKARNRKFTTAALPQPLVDKREKAARRAESKPAASAATTAGTARSNSRVEQQLQGLALAETVLQALTANGLAAVNGKTLLALKNQTKQLADCHLTGVQGLLLQLLDTFAMTDTEAMYTIVCQDAARVHALVQRGRSYLQDRLANPEAPRDTTSEIEAVLGTAWQLSDLAAIGNTSTAHLLQLAFTCYDNEAELHYQDLGVWLNLEESRVDLSVNYRPYRAVQHVPQEDSCDRMLTVRQCYHYPTAGQNRRIRWNELPSMTPPDDADWQAACQCRQTDGEHICRQVKQQLINPLCSRHPYVLLSCDEFSADKSGHFVRCGTVWFQLANAVSGGWADTLPVLSLLGRRLSQYSALLGRFAYRDGSLQVAPLSLLGPQGLLRLA